MTDLTELRTEGEAAAKKGMRVGHYSLEAADEIERLRTVLAGCDRALSRFLAHQLSHQDKYFVLKAARDNARAALSSPVDGAASS